MNGKNVGVGGGGIGEEGPLFMTRKAKGIVVYRGFIFSILAGIFFIIFYRLKHLPESGEPGRWAWIGMFISELFFSFYWIITQSARWNVVRRIPFKNRLIHRYEDNLPNVDVFICTADPKLEPPSLVINTVLSAMSYNYPPDKLTVYLSDDGGSDLTFYAMVEASKFSKLWVPFCKRFHVEPRSPQAYFAQSSAPVDDGSPFSDQWLSLKKLYEEMKVRIDEVSNQGNVPKDLGEFQHKGFLKWNSQMSKQSHPSIVQILIDLDEEDEVPRLVYLAREKNPEWHHNFKAGSMNALIRVSSVISNAPIILNVDCDMYSNDSNAILEALCFFMDEEQGHKIAFVQHPQSYNNITKNDIYANAVNPIHKIELAGISGYDSALYCGTGCFHRRISLIGSDYVKTDLKNDGKRQKSNIHELEEAAKIVANCSYEKDSQWGKQMGLVYGCAVEDIITGLSIQCRGWKSIYYYPEKRKSFVGLAPTTLEQCLVQYKRWSEGLSQIFFSKYCPFIFGHGKIKLGAQMGYCLYLLWATLSLPCLYYTIIPSISLIRGISLFPQPNSIWFIPFAYVYLSRNICSVIEALSCGDTMKGWINAQRMWLIRRTTAFAFALVDNIGRALGFSETAFAITTKVMDDDLKRRYEKEILEFGSESVMFAVVSTLAVLNLLCLIGGIVMRRSEVLVGQTVICLAVVAVNLPVYEALFFRSDNGRIPATVMIKSVLFALALCIILPVY